ncbi:MAG: trypsin-like peptidase domain-containing protein [Planctomycetes bacterium]|nr:trypsin-like peptidase domain-containing protein [Planctomycetota bacterium]
MLSFNKVVLTLSGLCFAAGIVLSIPLPFEPRRQGHAEALPPPAPPTKAIEKAEPLAVQLESLFSNIAKEVKPTVVAIVARKAGEEAGEELSTPEKALRRSFGSGFLIDTRGFILTNHHLVEGAGALEVTLADGRSGPGRIVRSDSTSDIALVKIELGNLPAARLGDSDSLEAGQWILAIGHPFGLMQTVSAGIVGALGRSDLSLLRYENFIQTDATISPGSSGGPLVNLHGEVVGINTAIYSHLGKVNHGISFAVPINLARALAERWILGGNISRMGIATIHVDRDMADYYSLARPCGAFISYVEKRSPAAVGGLLPMDLVVEFGGRKVRDRHDLRLMIAEQVPGEPVLVGVLRAGGKKTFEVIPAESSASVEAPPVLEDPEAGGSSAFGITVTTLTRELASSIGIPPAKTGVAIIDVDPESVAWRKGIRPGDVILGVNTSKVEDISQLDEAMSSAGEVTMLKIVSRGYDERFFFIRRSDR